MAKRLKELVCELDQGPVALRFKNSETFLSNEDTELDLGGTNIWAIWFCRFLFWFGLLALVGVMCLAFYIWMWDSSPLTSTVAADVVGYDQKSQGAVVRYQFEVDGKKVSAEQYANSTESKWRDANAKADVVYLNFMPSSNKLKKTVERMDWSILILGPIMPIVFLLGGHLGKRAMQRMARIEEKASHILRGEVTNRIRSKGTVIVQYKTKSPITNEEIFGGEQLGKLVPALKNMQIGSPVAIVYANDKEHTLL